MDKYTLVKKKRTEERSTDPTEIKITASGRIPSYITYAAKLFKGEEQRLTLKATGSALVKAVTVAEVLKRRIKGLHQLNTIGTTIVHDTYEPKEEGLDTVIHHRSMSTLEIVLSLKGLDEENPGYQEPLDEELVEEVEIDDIIRDRSDTEKKGRGRSRKGKGKKGKKGKGKKGKKGKGKGRRGDSADTGRDESDSDSGEDEKPKRKGRKGKGKGKRSSKGKGKRSSTRKSEGEREDSPDRKKSKGKGKGKRSKGKGKGRKGKGRSRDE